MIEPKKRGRRKKVIPVEVPVEPPKAAQPKQVYRQRRRGQPV